MVIVDNLESILIGGDVPLDAAARTQLWDVLLELATIGAAVVLTSRGTTFDDARLMPGKQVSYLELENLYNEDAYNLAIGLLNDLGIDRKFVPYMELRALLKQLGYHPLAIHLVLPTLRKLPLAKVTADLAVLLSMFVDDMTTGRNRSLLASLNYSLKQLNQEQQTLLHRLTVFEGGRWNMRYSRSRRFPKKSGSNYAQL